MAFVVKDRVKQSTTTTGTGSIVLNGTVSGFQTFANALSDGDTTYYAIFEVSTNEWEVGVGTWTESTTTLARTTVLASSNSNSAIDLSAQAEVFITQPAGKAAFFDPSGDLTLVQDPTSNLQAATKQYVDTIAAAGLHYHDPVRVEQEGNLSATYSNGTAGVGATLTNNSTQAALTIDGVALSLNDRVLIYEQTNGYENGIYTVTNVGSASTNWVLTRATDADSYAPSDPDSLGQGDAFFVLEGTAGAGELYVMNTEGTITFGTTNITFTQIAATAVYTAGTGLTLTGTEFAADGANITNVDAVTLDGIDSSQFLRSDVVDTKTAGNLNFSDNVKAQFGTGNDLQIYHDGSNSEIINTSSGHFLLGSASRIILAKNPFEYMANFQSDGAATLYYDNAAKFATSSTGISVTGTVNVPFKSVSTYTVSGINGGAVDTNGGDIVTGRIFFTGSSDSGTELFGFNNESTGLTLYNYVDGHYALYVANSNNIGLGTSTPGGKLEVNSNSSFPIIRARYNSSYYTDYNSNGITYNGSGQTFNFIDNGSTKVTIASGGNVGIGITSPTAALHVAKSSGNTIINLQRTNANTTGSVGTIQFSASDDHAVASIAAFGDGDDEGAYLSFRTTSSATTNSWYTGTDEAMRIDSNRDIRFYNDSGNVNLFWDASTMALGIGTGTTAPTNPITIQQTSVHWPYIALTNTSGTIKSQFGYQVNDDLLDIAANSGGIKFRTNNTETMRLTSAGNLGIGTSSPAAKLDVTNSSASHLLAIFDQDNTSYNTDISIKHASRSSDNTLITKRIDGDLWFYQSNDTDLEFFTNGLQRLIINGSGNVGIGTGSPQNKLTINTPQRTDGGTNSLGQLVVAGPISDSPSHDFTNGGTAIFRIQGTDATNNLQFGVGSSGYSYHPWIQGSYDNTSNNGPKAIILQPLGGNVGINTTNPQYQLHVDHGSATYSAFLDGEVVLRSNSPGSWNDGLNILDNNANGWAGITFHRGGSINAATTNKYWTGLRSGTNNYIMFGAPFSGIQSASNISAPRDDIIFEHKAGTTGYPFEFYVPVNFGQKVGIGTSSPQYPLHISGGSSTRADLLLSYDAIGNGATDGMQVGIQATNGGYNWVFENMDWYVGTNNTRKLTVKNNGYVGIGISSPSQELHVHTTSSGNADVRLTGNNQTSTYMDVYSGTTSSGLWVTGSSDMRLGTNGTERLTIDTSGNVGIGTASPTQRLHVQGGQLRVSNGSDFYINSLAANSYIYTSSTPFDIYTAGNFRMRVGSTGDVSIGNNAAFTIGGSAKLTVLGASGTVYLAGGSASGDQFYLRKNASVAGMYEWQTYYSSLNQGTIQIQPYGGSITIGGSNATTTHKLQVFGSFAATTKSFVIDHPTKEGMKLRHGSLEGPEDGVYVRGRLTGKTVIELPDYWTGLVHEDSITVQLTAMGGKADLWVESIADNKVTVGCDTEVDCFYFVQATRKDVDAWDVEYVADS